MQSINQETLLSKLIRKWVLILKQKNEKEVNAANEDLLGEAEIEQLPPISAE